MSKGKKKKKGKPGRVLIYRSCFVVSVCVYMYIHTDVCTQQIPWGHGSPRSRLCTPLSPQGALDVAVSPLRMLGVPGPTWGNITSP